MRAGYFAEAPSTKGSQPALHVFYVVRGFRFQTQNSRLKVFRAAFYLCQERVDQQIGGIVGCHGGNTWRPKPNSVSVPFGRNPRADLSSGERNEAQMRI